MTTARIFPLINSAVLARDSHWLSRCFFRVSKGTENLIRFTSFKVNDALLHFYGCSAKNLHAAVRLHLVTVNKWKFCWSGPVSSCSLLLSIRIDAFALVLLIIFFSLCIVDFPRMLWNMFLLPSIVPCKSFSFIDTNTMPGRRKLSSLLHYQTVSLRVCCLCMWLP